MTDTVIEGNEPLEAGMSGMNTVSDEAEQALSESAAAETAQEGFVQAELPLEKPSFQAKLSGQRNLPKKLFRQPEKPVLTETDADKTQMKQRGRDTDCSPFFV